MDADKKLTEKQKEAITNLQNQIDGYENKLIALYNAVNELVDKKLKAEKELKELKDTTDQDKTAGEEVLRLIEEAKAKLPKLDAQILNIENLLKK
jgi:chromosome segregation ATPase